MKWILRGRAFYCGIGEGVEGVGVMYYTGIPNLLAEGVGWAW